MIKFSRRISGVKGTKGTKGTEGTKVTSISIPKAIVSLYLVSAIGQDITDASKGSNSFLLNTLYKAVDNFIVLWEEEGHSNGKGLSSYVIGKLLEEVLPEEIFLEVKKVQKKL